MRVLAEGRGPGPRNVLVEHEDGKKVVYTWRIKKKLANNSEFATVAGFVQFDPQPAEANGQRVRHVTIQNISGQDHVRVTIWETHESTPINRGDFLAATGKYSSRVAQDRKGIERTYHNLSATDIVVIPAAEKKPREVVNRPGPSNEIPF